MTQLGDLSIGLLLDVKGFGEGIKTSLNLLTMFSKSANEILQLKPPTFKTSDFDAEIKKLDATLEQFQTELEGTVVTEEQVSIASEEAAASVGQLDSTAKSSTTAFQQLNRDIKEAKSKLLELSAAGESGSAEWKKYSNTLKELTLQKQILQKQTKVTSQQFVGMAGDIGIVGMGIRGLIQDVRNLGDTKQSPLDLALSIGQIGISAITILPGLHAINKALQAMGFISAGTVAVIGTLTAGIAAVGTAITLTVQGIIHAGDMFDRLKLVLSGQMNYWDALAQNIANVTFGLIDFTNQASDAEEMLNRLGKTEKELGNERIRREHKELGIDPRITENSIRLDAEQEKLNEDKQRQQEIYSQEINKPKEKKPVTHSSSQQQHREEVKQMEQKLTLVDEENKKLDELKVKLELNKGERGAELEILKEIEKVQARILFLQTGERPLDAILKELDPGKLVAQMKEDMLKRQLEIAENQKKIDQQIKEKKIALTEDEFAKRRAEIENTYELELEKINEINDATDEQRALLNKLALQDKNRNLERLEAEIVKRKYDSIVDSLSAAGSIIDVISNKLLKGADNFGTILLRSLKAGLEIAMQIAKFAGKGSAAGASDILNLFSGIFGTFLSFLPFASGGHVPGSGSGDTVPAMLTPGEFVIRKTRVNDLINQYGSNFLSWLNGGGMLPALAGHYNVGGMVTSAISASSGTSIILNGKVLDGAMKRKIAAEGIYLENLSISRRSF